MELNESKIREGLRNALPYCDPVIENRGRSPHPRDAATAAVIYAERGSA